MTLPSDRRIILPTETHAVSDLLTDSLALLAQHPGPGNAEAFFACLAIGMQKLLKLSLGLDGVQRHGGWPSRAMMRDRYGHDIQAMDTEVRQIIRDHADRNQGHVPSILDGLDSDPLIGQLIEAVTQYATHDPLHDLDHLAEDPPTAVSPRHLWSDLGAHVSTHELIAETLSTLDNPSAWPKAVVAGVDRSIRAWVDCYRLAWEHGVFGPLGVQMSTALRVV